MARADKVVLLGVAEPQEGFIILPGAQPVLDHPLLERRFLDGGLGCQNNPPPAVYVPSATWAPSVSPSPDALGKPV